MPYYVGDKYLFLAAAADDTWQNSEYPTYLYSAGHQAWDVSDPSHPTRLSTWHRPGQVKGEEDAYRQNPRCGNRTSWMGARMPLFIPVPVEQGGKYGFAAMGGFGLSVVDISNPAEMAEVGHLDLPPSVAGTEGDNIDVSQYAKTGLIYFSGYPLTEDCYEPYKDIFQIDVSDPTTPRIVGTLPRPTPPKHAMFLDFCQRRGSFGPKRTGYYTSPGEPRNGLLVYGFYNAGIQVFDVSNPKAPRIAAYFVPKAGADLSIYHPAQSGSGWMDHLAIDFSLEDLERMRERLVEAGVAVEGPIDRGYERSIYFRDPNGVTIELLAWLTPVPSGMKQADVLRRAQTLREKRGATLIEDEDVRAAIAALD